jgi:hypothetical protein
MNKEMRKEMKMKKVIAATAIALGMSTTANAIEQSSEADRIWTFSRVSLLCSATDVVLTDAWFEMAKDLQAEIGQDYKPRPVSEDLVKRFMMEVVTSPRTTCGADNFFATNKLLLNFRINH